MGFTMENTIDTAALIIMSVLVLAMCAPKKKLVRWQGALMLAIYAGYTVYLIKR